MGQDRSPRLSQGHTRIEAYGDGGFRIGGQRFLHAVLVTARGAEHWAVGTLPFPDGVPEPAAFRPLLNEQGIARAGLILFGMGARLLPVPRSWREQMRELGLRVEVMDTGAACRTFSVLQAEDRDVAAALLPLP